MEQYIILALISMLFFGVNAVILKSAKNIDSVTLTLISLATAVILTLVYWIFFVSKKEFSIQGAGFGLLSGMAYTIALVLFVMAIKQGKVSIVATINALSAGVAVILSVVLLSEQLTTVKIVGVVLGIAAAVLLAL
jgi:transporter family protein